MTEPSMSAASAWPRRIAAFALVAGLIFAAVVGAIVNATMRGHFPRVPLSGWIGPAAFSELRFAQFLARGEVSPALAERARRAARWDALAYEPFLYLAASDFRGQESLGLPRDAALLREALRRNPRSRQARGLLLRQSIGAGKLGEAIDQIAELGKLGQPGAAALLDGVGRAIVTPAQIDEAVAALRRHPQLYGGMVSGFVAAPKPVEAVTRLARALPPAALARDNVDRLIIGKLVDLGAFREARQIWLRAGGRGGAGPVNDPAFADRSPIPPFAWDMIQSDTGVAERQGEGGLYVEYYGRAPGPLLRQLVTLAPGAYRAQLELEPPGAGGGSIAVRIACAGNGGAELAARPLRFERAGRQKLAVPFTVPAERCDGQTLELQGLPNDGRKGQQVVIHRFALVAGAPR